MKLCCLLLCADLCLRGAATECTGGACICFVDFADARSPDNASLFALSRVTALCAIVRRVQGAVHVGSACAATLQRTLYCDGALCASVLWRRATVACAGPPSAGPGIDARCAAKSVDSLEGYSRNKEHRADQNLQHADPAPTLTVNPATRRIALL